MASINVDELINEYLLEIDERIKKENELNKLREKFVEDYPIDRIENLTKEEYCLGFKKVGKNNYTFCYRIENELKKLGNMHGATAEKFGVYYGENPKGSGIFEYLFTDKYGETLDNAFDNLKKEIVNLIDYGKTYNKELIEKSKIAPLFKYKLLSTYYPDLFINIFNEQHINEFLNELGIKYSNKDRMIDKQEYLIQFKNNNEIMKDWSLNIFMGFLYTKIEIPSRVKSKDKQDQKEFDKKYSKKYQYNLKITKEQWKTMLLNRDIFTEENINLLKDIYVCDNHASTCKNLELENGVPAQSYNKPIVSLARRILDYTGNKPQIINGKEKFWNVIFWGQRLNNGLFEWKIKPKLAEALGELYPNIKSIKINDELDNRLTIDTSKATSEFDKASGDYSTEEPKKPIEIITKGTSAYKRDRSVAINALKIADFSCEYDKSHKTFLRKNVNYNYTEPHHLIPMANQNEFDMSIDIEENIVSLCSNCHNEIHYGRDAKRIIEKLYEERKDILETKGIKLSIDKLLSYYGIK